MRLPPVASRRRVLRTVWFKPDTFGNQQVADPSRIIDSLLAALPQLKNFVTEDFQVIDNTNGRNVLSQVIPFFEGGNLFVLKSHWKGAISPGPPDWIQPSARFGELEIDISYFRYKAVLMNKWFSSSCATLTSLTIRGNPECKC